MLGGMVGRARQRVRAAWSARTRLWGEGALASAVGRRVPQEVVSLTLAGDSVEREEMAEAGIVARPAVMETDRVRPAVVSAHTTDKRGGGYYTGVGRLQDKR
jgi:hypothetical protein